MTLIPVEKPPVQVQKCHCTFLLRDLRSRNKRQTSRTFQMNWLHLKIAFKWWLSRTTEIDRQMHTHYTSYAGSLHHRTTSLSSSNYWNNNIDRLKDHFRSVRWFLWSLHSIRIIWDTFEWRPPVMLIVLKFYSQTNNSTNVKCRPK